MTSNTVGGMKNTTELTSPAPIEAMQCFVYKGHLKADSFLFLPCKLEDLLIAEPQTEQDETSDSEAAQSAPEYRNLPDALLERLGSLAFVTEFTLHAERRMPQADPVKVLSALQTHGFYLQMPRVSVSDLEDFYFA